MRSITSRPMATQKMRGNGTLASGSRGAFDTGAVRNVMILSVPEGDDKPLKYPLMFTICDALVVNKIDYLAIADFDMKVLKERVLKLNPGIRIFEVSCRTGEGIPAWIEWLRDEIAAFKNL